MWNRDKQAQTCLNQWCGFNTGMIISVPYPKKESSLSQILQNPQDVHKKYYLSAKACQGILNRAEKRGKELPAPLKKALEQQAKLSTGGGTFDVRISSDGTHNFRAHCYETDICRSLDTHAPDPNTNHGGVAILEQKRAYSFDSLASNSMKSNNPNSGCRAVEIAKTLDCGVPDPSKNQGGIAVLEDATIYPINTQNITRNTDDKRRGFGIGENGDPMFTLEAGHSHGVIMDMTHANDVIRESKGLSPTLNARMGTGGNQVPLVFALEGNGSRESHHVPGFTDNNKMYTLNTVEHHAVAYCMGHDERSAQFEKNKTDPLTASDYKQPPVVAQPVSTTGGGADVLECKQGRPHGEVFQKHSRSVDGNGLERRTCTCNGKQTVGSLCAHDGRGFNGQDVSNDKLIIEQYETDNNS